MTGERGGETEESGWLVERAVQEQRETQTNKRGPGSKPNSSRI